MGTAQQAELSREGRMSAKHTSTHTWLHTLSRHRGLWLAHPEDDALPSVWDRSTPPPRQSWAPGAPVPPWAPQEV